jgi:hypothetical protein
VGKGGRDECGEERRAARPFIGSQGKRGGRTGKGIGRPMVGSEAEGKCGAFFRRGGVIGGGGRQRVRGLQRRPVRLPEEEDSRAANRVGPPVSEGEAVGQARSEGGGREVGHGWARNRKLPDSRNKILLNFIWNLDFWQTLEICTRRF